MISSAVGRAAGFCTSSQRMSFHTSGEYLGTQGRGVCGLWIQPPFGEGRDSSRAGKAKRGLPLFAVVACHPLLPHALAADGLDPPLQHPSSNTRITVLHSQCTAIPTNPTRTPGVDSLAADGLHPPLQHTRPDLCIAGPPARQEQRAARAQLVQDAAQGPHVCRHVEWES